MGQFAVKLLALSTLGDKLKSLSDIWKASHLGGEVVGDLSPLYLDYPFLLQFVNQ